MTNLTQKSSQQFFGAAIRVVTVALFLITSQPARRWLKPGLRDEFCLTTRSP